MSGLVLFLILGSVYRITMLVTEDTITAPARDALLRWMNQPRHVPVVEVKVGPEWVRMKCRCGFSVHRVGTHLAVLDPAGPDEWVSTPIALDDRSDMAVLAAFNSHRNGHREPRFTVWPVWLTCPWCCSVAVAPIVVASGITYGTHGWWLLVAGTLTASAVTGIIATFAKP